MRQVLLGDLTVLDGFLLFVAFSFLGWALEVLYALYRRQGYVNRGFLWGPFCPIYGFGTLLILRVVSPLYQEVPFAPDGRLLMVFVLAAASTTLVELLTGWLLEKVFHQRWWDYSQERLNLGGYISLKFSLYWGVGGTLLYSALAFLGLTDGLNLTEPWRSRVSYGAFGVLLYLVGDVTRSVDLAFRLKIFLAEVAEAAGELREKVRDLDLESLWLEAMQRKERLEESVLEVQERLARHTGQRRNELELALHRYAALFERRRILPFRHFLKAFPRMRYIKMEGVLEGIRERFSTLSLPSILNGSAVPEEAAPEGALPLVGHYADVPGRVPGGSGLSGVMVHRLLGPESGWPGWALRIFSVEPGGYTPEHRHSWPHINVVLSGKGVLLVEGEPRTLRPGSYAFLPADTLHRFRNTGTEPLVFVCIVSEEGDR
mgnify:CR=1 FL=1